jgi:hypothetical protein
MVGSLSGSLPTDVLPIIFLNMTTDLPHLALVCKNWKVIVDNKQFREMICLAKAFGSREWKEYMGVDVGEEPLLPRRAYGDMEKGNYYLTFIPEKVKKTQVNGKVDDASRDIEEVKEVPLDSLEVIGQLVANRINGNNVGFYPNAWQEAISKKRSLEKPHWVLISKEVIGKNKTYEEHQKLAKEENKNSPGANISGLIDSILSVFMEYVRSGERNFEWDSAKNQNNWIRVNEKTGGIRISLGFAPSGLNVFSRCGHAYTDVGFALAWKSFGL